MMKRNTSLIAIIISLTMSAAVFAEDIAVSEQPPTPVASGNGSAASQNQDAQVPVYPKHGMGMKHKGGCQHGNTTGEKKHGCQHDKDKRDKHADVVRRLDMIEARMARIEAMLKALLRR